ncbi:hypothetical protein AB5N19_13810 [Seiridium cardinale]
MPHHFSAAADEALRKGEPETAWVLSSGLIGNANLLGQGSLISTPRDTANVIERAIPVRNTIGDTATSDLSGRSNDGSLLPSIRRFWLPSRHLACED